MAYFSYILGWSLKIDLVFAGTSFTFGCELGRMARTAPYLTGSWPGRSGSRAGVGKAAHELTRLL